MATRKDRWADAMRAALDGDGVAYERLLGEIAVMSRGVARSRLVRFGIDPDEAEDVVQEVLIAVHRKRGTWDPERPFLPWLNAIARYKLIDAVRRLGRARRRTAGEPVEDMADRLPAPPAPELAYALADPARAVARLSARERDVVTALGLEGLSVRRTAARFSISEAAVRVAFHRGLARVSRMVDAAPTVSGSTE